MKGFAHYLAAAGMLAVLGALCLGASRLDRQVADAQQMLLTSDYDSADASLSDVERYYAVRERRARGWRGTGE